MLMFLVWEGKRSSLWFHFTVIKNIVMIITMNFFFLFQEGIVWWGVAFSLLNVCYFSSNFQMSTLSFRIVSFEKIIQLSCEHQCSDLDLSIKYSKMIIALIRLLCDDSTLHHSDILIFCYTFLLLGACSDSL